jgi:hypothetical protein
MLTSLQKQNACDCVAAAGEEAGAVEEEPEAAVALSVTSA